MTADRIPPAVVEFLREQEIRADERAKIVREIADASANLDALTITQQSRTAITVMQIRAQTVRLVGADVALGGAK
ncbi:MAG: hypothetical protein ACOH10_12565 [Rhodoglobus sp.]